MRLPKILIISGSNRDGSYNTQLAASAHKVFSTLECEASRISLRDYLLPILDEDLMTQKGSPENAIKLARMFEAHDGVMLMSPEYNASLSPLLKNMMDWVSMTKKDQKGPIAAYQNTIFALAAASPGKLGGIRGLSHARDILTSIGATVIASQVGVGNADTAFDENDRITDERTRGLLLASCESLVKSARLLSMK